MRQADRYIIAKMFLFIIEGFAVLLNVLYNPSIAEGITDNWMDKVKKFGDEVDEWSKS